MNLKLFGFFLLLLTANNLAAQTSAQYSSVDALVTNFPLNIRSAADLRVLQNELKRQLKTEDELARAAFIWISNNIAYDCEGLNKGQGFYELKDVVANKKGICAGYAVLFKDFCDQFGLECMVIEGLAINYHNDIPLHADSIESNHAWNVVKINGAWKLVDPTWGSGYTSAGCGSFTRGRNEIYYCSKPEEFIKDHFPDDSSWQLLEKPVAGQPFLDSARKHRKEMQTLYEEKPVTVIILPKDSVIKKQVGQSIRFTFITKDKANKAIVWSNSNENINDEGKLAVTKNGYYYDYKIKYPGKYDLSVSIVMDVGQAEVEVIHTGDYILDIP